MSENDRKLLSQLIDNWEILKKSQSSLLKVYVLVKKPMKDLVLSDQEEIDYEALTSRLARTTDIFTSKVIKLIFFLNKEYPKTFIDQINLAEKLNLVTDSDKIGEIKELRNQIVHEYVLENINDLYIKAYSLTTELIDSIRLTETYLIDKNWINIHKQIK